MAKNLRYVEHAGCHCAGCNGLAIVMFPSASGHHFGFTLAFIIGINDLILANDVVTEPSTEQLQELAGR